MKPILVTKTFVACGGGRSGRLRASYGSAAAAAAVSHHLRPSTFTLAAPRRGVNMSDPSQLFTSPGGLMALLYGRTGPLGGSASSSSNNINNDDGVDGEKRKKNLGGSDNSDSSGDAPVASSRAGRRGRRFVLRTNSRSGASTDTAKDSGGGGGDGRWREKLRTFSRTLFGSEAFWLAFLVFGLSSLWEVCKAQQGVVREKTKNFFLTTLAVRSSQPEYAMIIDWMARQPRSQYSRNLSLRPVTIADEQSLSEQGKILRDDRSVLVPGYGVHILDFEGTRLWVSREQDTTKSQANFAQNLDREHDILTITFFTRSRDVVVNFLAAVAENWKANLSNRVRILAGSYDSWQLLSERARRPMDTLYLPPETKEVLDEIRTFFGLQETYTRLGIPWRRGYLFEGPPGTGKSSYILALAGELGLPVCILSLQSRGMDDERLMTNITRLPPRCIVLMEDFENAVSVSSKGKSALVSGGEGGGVSLSGLLNAMDGVASTEGRLLIMTSNDLSRIPLPDALLRPGRIDRRVRFDTLTTTQAAEMRDAFVRVMRESPNPVLNTAATTAEQQGLGKGKESPAAFQQSMLQNVFKAYKEAACTAGTEPLSGIAEKKN